MERHKFIKDLNPSDLNLNEDQIKNNVQKFFNEALKEYHENPNTFIIKADIRVSYKEEGVIKYKLVYISNKVFSKDLNPLLTGFYLKCNQKNVRIASLKKIFFYI